MGRKLTVSEPLIRRWNSRRITQFGGYTSGANRRRWRTPADQRTTVTLSLSDDDFANLASGKTQAQRLFMSGKLKIKGDVMKVG